MPDSKLAVLDLVLEKGLERREEAFRLSSGEWSHDYIDGKKAISDGRDLKLAAQAIVELCDERGVEFDAVGGLTMGADPLAHAIAMLRECGWFSVRKEEKQHGKQRLIEGTELTPETRVLVVDDVVTTGKSIVQALEAITGYGAPVVLAVCVIDRGKRAVELLGEMGVEYAPLLQYSDLGIAAVGVD